MTGSTAVPLATADRRPRRWPLLITVPVAVVLSAPVLLYGALAYCGISGCSGGGFGPTTVARGDSYACCAIIGALFTLAVVFVPWIRPAWQRVLLSTGIGVVLGFAAFAWILGGS